MFLTHEGFTIVGEADGPAAIHSVLVRSRPHLLLLTPSAVGDLETIRRTHERHPTTRIIVLTEGRLSEDLSSYLVAGARGVVSERETDGTLLKAIPAVLGGEIWAGRKVVARAIERLIMTTPAPVTAERPARARLTRGELMVAELVAQGCSNEEIAKRLGRSERTVRNHLTRIFRKLDCRNRVTLAMLLLCEPATTADRQDVASPHSSAFRPLEHGDHQERPSEQRAPGVRTPGATPRRDPLPPSPFPP